MGNETVEVVDGNVDAQEKLEHIAGKRRRAIQANATPVEADGRLQLVKY